MSLIEEDQSKTNILIQVEKFLSDQLTKENLSTEVDKTRQALLEKVKKCLESGDKKIPLRSNRSSQKKHNRLSLDLKYPDSELNSEGGLSKRNSKCVEGKETNTYETNFVIMRGGDQSDSCDGSDYESTEDRQSVNSTQSDKRHPVNAKRHSQTHSQRYSKIKTNPEFRNCDRKYEGYLYKKGKLNSYKKLYCIIFDKWLVCLPKDSKQQHRIKLEGYEATYHGCKENSKYEHELRLVGPGLKSHSFFTKDKVDATLWVVELTKALEMTNDGSNMCNENINASNFDPDNSSINAYDNMDGNSTEYSKPSIFHNLITKVKQKAMAAFDSLDNYGDKNVSGVLHVTYDDLSKHTWMQKFCIIKLKNLEVHRCAGSDRPEVIFPLVGAHLRLIPNSDFFVLCLNQPGQKIFIKFNNHPELNKWYQNFQRVVHVLPEAPRDVQHDEDVSLYDEIGESQGSGVNRPPLPECPAPMTPDVMGALMNMDEVGYMDVLECRQPIRADPNERMFHETYEEVNLYVNKNSDLKRVDKKSSTTSSSSTTTSSNKTDVEKSLYCPMTRDKSSTTSKTTPTTTSKTTPTTTSKTTPTTTSKTTSATSATTTSTSTTAAASSGCIPPHSVIRAKTPSGPFVTSKASNHSSNAAKVTSVLDKTREKFEKTPVNSLTSTEGKPSLSPAQNKWSTNLLRNARLATTTNSNPFSDSTTKPTDELVDCQLRKSKSRSSTPSSDDSKRNSECHGKSNLIQEKLKIFQKDS